MKKLKIIIITTGYSSFIPNLHTAEIADIVGVLDCADDTCLKKYVDERNIPYNILIQQNQELQEWIKNKNAHLIIVYKMPFLLKKGIFSIPKYGSINIHPSLLPQYRGPNPWFWIYFNKEKESGVTLHRIDEKEDHGDILTQAKFDIELGACLNDLQSIVETKSISLLKEILPQIGTIKGKYQNSFLSQFRVYGNIDYKSIVDINNIDVVNLWHILRGFPWLIPVLYSDLECEGEYKIKGFTNQYYRDSDIGNIEKDESNIYLYCKNGIIEVLKI